MPYFPRFSSMISLSVSGSRCLSTLPYPRSAEGLASVGPRKADCRTVDELPNRLLIRVAVCHKRLDNLQHLHGGLGDFDEDTIVDLQQPQKLQRLALLRVDLVDALDADDESELGFRRDIQAVALLGFTRQPYPFPVGVAVFLDVFLCTRENHFSLFRALCCHMSVSSTMKKCAMRRREGDCIIPERWLTIRQH